MSKRILILALVAVQVQAKEQEFVDIKSHITNVNYDIRYYSGNNFVGERIDGYKAAKCLVHKNAIAALSKASEALNKAGDRFKFFDCYRPEKAVAHFMRWAKDLEDIKTKKTYYPNLDKSAFVGPYIAPRSGHSKGYTVDLTLEQKQPNGSYTEVDMGSAFDMFDLVSNTDNPSITKQQKANRYLLKKSLEAVGFSAYDMEWWHFTYTAVPSNERATFYDFDVK
ncbi:M15 family metallopeptidase [Thalassotalea agarivorans]|uniref:D-alanyl-D-alanine dipeptidase n=1 Tax=Thalassotalea agarivorans TaxID=349064 RepID=A0A1H9Y531_THASX|nr:M15 family metallopeptidase [Thalassotalea agarivorans]SES63957.1 D-alanyl-D-alanine dipeptidase [Thalassotalea agarivorans]